MRILTIRARDPRRDREEQELMPPGAFANLRNLEELTVTNREGWREHTLTQGTLDGLENLRKLKIDYLEAVEPDALERTATLEQVRLHGAEGWDDFPPKIHAGLFRELDRLRYAEIRNFRWPPVLEVDNLRVACSAREWRSFTSPDDTGKKPLSILLKGKYQRPRDLESLGGCDQEPGG